MQKNMQNEMQKKVKGIIRRLLMPAVMITAIQAAGAAEKSECPTEACPLPIMDMVHHNPGEATTKSHYLDPQFLQDAGFGAKVFFLFDAAQFGIDWRDFSPEIFPEGSDGAAWVAEKADSITARYNAAKAAGLDVYCMLDMLVLPGRLVDAHRAEICNEKGKIDISRPYTRRCVSYLLRSMFEKFPQLDGLIVRTGETYLHDAHHHVGNHPVQNGMDDHVTLINLLRDEVCERLGKKVFYRTWDMGQLHSLPHHYLSVTDKVEPHPNLYFSVKHTMTDFWRSGITADRPDFDSIDTYWLEESGHYGVPFNPTLGIGRHKQIVEVQCQREYEGKGAHPNYIAHGVIDGFSELLHCQPPFCLKHLRQDGKLAGIWTWSRGVGWGGPYISNEFWVDLNARVLALWAGNPSLTEEECFNTFARERGLPEEELPLFRRMCLLSEAGVLAGQYSRYGGTFVNWTRDDTMTGDAFQKGYLETIARNGTSELYMREKEDAVDIWREIERLGHSLHFRSADDTEYVAVSSTYGRIKYEIMATAWKIMTAGIDGKEPDAEVMRRDIARYDSLWEEWRQLKADHLCCPTLYKGDASFFGNPTGINQMVDRYRKS